MSVLILRNRQHTRPIDLRLLRKVTIFLLKEILEAPDFELGIHLVGADEMAKVNETFLQHTGSTDVITFDYGERADGILSAEEKTFESRANFLPTRCRPHVLHGEIFISLDDAVAQARKFQSTWQSELARYIVHGILHLQGYDDLDPVSRRQMKRAETQTLKQLAKQFPLQQLQRKL